MSIKQGYIWSAVNPVISRLNIGEITESFHFIMQREGSIFSA